MIVFATVYCNKNIYIFRSSKVTHGGRLAGAIEAEMVGLPEYVIEKEAGNWRERETHLQTHYLGELPSQFVVGIAELRGKPFNLARNSVSPPLELKHLVFPWIEGIHSILNKAWKKVCYLKMEECNENIDNGTAVDETQPLENNSLH